ncbi:MAG: peptide transporter substrate-binding protein [Dehalococcoidia bacterium]|nr:peptide transporter substrate-binding protein [Dehalococcoidia bacterium]
MWFRSKGVLAVAVAGLLLAACAPSAAPTGDKAAIETEKAAPGAPTGAQGAPKRGGTYVNTATGSYAGTDPAMGQMSYNVWPFVGLMMLKVEPETWKVVVEGVESWEFTPDGKELTLHVRKGMKFPNVPPTSGREVEAKDVVYTLKGITGQLYPDLPPVRFPRKANLEEMVDAVAVDKYTVKVTLSKASATFVPGLTDYRGGYILPEGIRESFGDIQSLVAPSVDKYVSAGPFRLTKFVQVTEATYERNPDYWKKGQPYLDKIRTIWIPDRSTLNAAFIAGQIDSRATLSDEERSFILRSRKDARVLTYAPGSTWYRLAFNTTRKPFDDVRVRKAISLLIDSKQIGDAMVGSWEGKPLWKYPGPLPWVFPEAIPQEELSAMQVLKGPTPENVAEAKRLLKEAGYEKGFETQIMTPTSGSISYVDGAQIMQEQIRKHLPEIKITLSPVDNSINYSRYSNPKMDQLLDQAAGELNDQKRNELLKQAQLLALEDLPYRPVVHRQGQQISQPWVHGERLGAATSPNVWFEEIWLDPMPKR